MALFEAENRKKQYLSLISNFVLLFKNCHCQYYYIIIIVVCLYLIDSYECMKDENANAVPAIQHCWNVGPGKRECIVKGLSAGVDYK